MTFGPDRVLPVPESLSRVGRLDDVQTIVQFLVRRERRAYRMAHFATGDSEEALEVVPEAMLDRVRVYRARPTEEWAPLLYRILQSRICSRLAPRLRSKGKPGAHCRKRRCRLTAVPHGRRYGGTGGMIALAVSTIFYVSRQLRVLWTRPVKQPLRFILTVALTLPGVTGAVAADDQSKQLREILRKTAPELSFEDVRPSPVPGLYEAVTGTRVLYLTPDGKYMFSGNLIELESRRNLTQVRRAGLINRMFDAIGEHNMIVMGPKQAKRTITVFTDVDCPYCARLHLEIPRLNRAGVRVRYLLFPRGGTASETYRRSVAVWCASDRIKAVGVAKAGGKLDMKTCDNPVARHYALGQELGVEGTPTLVLDDGEFLPGYVPATQLLAYLGIPTEAN